MSKRPKSATVQVGLRLKESLRARLEKSAKVNGVSLNAEIVNRIEDSLYADDLYPEVRRQVEAQMSKMLFKLIPILERAEPWLRMEIAQELRHRAEEYERQGVGLQQQAKELRDEADERERQAGQQRKRGTR